MFIRKLLLVVSISLIGPLYLISQIPANDLGLNPSSLKWRQIKTEKTQVIFPKGLEPSAQHVANLVHYLWDQPSIAVGEKRTPATILLHNQTTIPNGFVTVGPFRSEFYMTPPQFDVTTDWLDILTIHEYRHIQQYANTERGITKVVKNVLGSWAWGGMFSTALPRWYMEGDAVDVETRLTASGRGRQPAFTMEYKALLEAGTDYSYEKASAGSLQDFVPNWYRLGYHLVAYGREKYGPELWANAVKDAVTYEGLFFPFSKSIRKQTGLTTTGLYEEMVVDLKESFQRNDPKETLESPELTTINQKKKPTVINYNNPKYRANGRLIVEKSGYDQIPAYYEVDSEGDETRLVESGVLLDRPYAPLSFANETLCWAELAFHPRWQNKNYSIIRLFNLNTRQKIKLTSKTRYFAPDLSEDGAQIIAVEIDDQLQNRLVILNAQNGDLLRTIENEENLFISFPTWVDKDHIVYIVKKNEQHALEMLDLNSGIKSLLTPFTDHQLSHPQPFGELVYFAAGYTAENNIFAVSTSEDTIYQITDSKLGAFQPAISPNGEKIAFSEFSVNGFDVVEMALNPETWRALDLSSYQKSFFAESLSQNQSILTDFPEKNFPVKKFNKWSGIFNPHSLLPYINPPIAGISVLSDNKFSTLSANAGAFYNYNENEWQYTGGLTYAELFPLFSVNFRRANRSANFFNFSRPQDTLVISSFYQEDWVEDDLSIGLSVPLTLSQGNFSNQMRFSVDWHQLWVDSDESIDSPEIGRDTIAVNGQPNSQLDNVIKSPLGDETFQALDWRFRFATLKRRARQHLNPQWGMLLDVRYRHLLNEVDYKGDVWLYRGDFYLPGFLRNHSLVINTMYQTNGFLDNYRFPNQFFYPRGYNALSSDDVFKVGVNYAFPISYPDLAIGPLAFLKRIKANIFYDYAKLNTGFPFEETPSLNTDLSSVGAELRLDMRALRLVEIDFGLRYSFLLNEDLAPVKGGRHQFDFLLISISGN